MRTIGQTVCLKSIFDFLNMFSLTRTLLTIVLLAGSAELVSIDAFAPRVGDAWELKRTGDDMWVYTRDKAGSAVKEVKLVMKVEATINEINAVLNDAERQPEWVYRCLEGRGLGGNIETGWYYYSLIDMPWPMEDRDVVGKVTGGRQGNTYSSSTIAAPKRTPEVKGVVRLTDFAVKTSYKSVDAKTTEVTYQLHSEPGGQVPSWLVNMFVDKGPVETMTKLRDLVED